MRNPLPTMPIPHRHPHPSLLKGAFVVAGLLGLTLGCRPDGVSHFRVPKEAATAPRPNLPGQAEEAMSPQGSGQESAPAAAGRGPLKWSLPKGWSELPGDGMRFATFKTPVSGRLEATVVVLPGPAGGELANVNRWRGQISLPPIDEQALAAARVVLKTKAGAVNLYDFTNDGPSKSRLVAGLISTPDGNTWFLKLTGDAAAAAKAKPDFMRLLESLRLD